MKRITQVGTSKPLTIGKAPRAIKLKNRSPATVKKKAEQRISNLEDVNNKCETETLQIQVELEEPQLKLDEAKNRSRRSNSRSAAAARRRHEFIGLIDDFERLGALEGIVQLSKLKMQVRIFQGIQQAKDFLLSLRNNNANKGH
ncbi:hypothetical protein NDU88_001911 [Pleurodeles waltl]|uniref:Uncharacterized protein n=1 Tax=Pleurodeles waltl TaxID=8319 RepID=A0AAV7RAG6_PLEWA|nr:hypothetical protein NDU88_001911 [Pleurodeles waltl]